MKRTILLTVFSCFLLQLSAQRVWYVKAGLQGDGSSWQHATGDLQFVLRSAKYGDQIWIGAGTYTPTSSNDRTASFTIPDGVQLYGGFAGFETTLQQRDFSRNATTLSGNIGSPAANDNAYTVVRTNQVSDKTVLDGFIIADGYADGNTDRDQAHGNGAGWFNDGSNGASNPVIRNCIFRNNFAYDGAGMFNNAKNGFCQPTIENCLFEANQADSKGGAIFNDGTSGKCEPRITFSTFQDNKATYGAGILNQGFNGFSSPLVLNCVFTKNIAYVGGSAVYNDRRHGGDCRPVMQSCVFEENYSTVGKDVGSNGNLAPTSSSAQNHGTAKFRSGY